MSLAAKLLSASGGVDKLYVDDVFSAYTFIGNNAAQDINNGIDLAGKGGLAWFKRRDIEGSHFLFDSARGASAGSAKSLCTNSNDLQEMAYPNAVNFTSAGCSLVANASSPGGLNTNNGAHVGWFFRRAPKFFDVVTYTGNGASSRAITHLLGQEVGMVMTKTISTTGNWNTYHRSATGDLVLNSTAAQTGSKALVNSATATTFTVSGAANTNAVTYVAYLFAHDPSADGIVQCGSAVTDASSNVVVTLPWEPQFVLVRRATGASVWYQLDISRGFVATGGISSVLCANSSQAEAAANVLGIGVASLSATGFALHDSGGASQTYIYLAIRRHNKPPTTGTQVYNAIARTGTGAAATVTGVGFAPDLLIATGRTKAAISATAVWDRLRGAARALFSNQTVVEANETLAVTAFNPDGISVGSGVYINDAAESSYINHFFKRAPGVFDVVCYTGTGAAKTEAHGLGAVPELIIVKNRGGVDNWGVWYKNVPLNGNLKLNLADGHSASGYVATSVTSTTFNPQTFASSVSTYVAYLFASLPGISKVGSYTGNGTTQTINCGFTTGARFVLIKRTDAAGDWYIWDTVRGLVAGNDPHLSLNSTTAEITTDDSLDPASVGFIVNQLAATNINVTSASYIYLSFA